MTDEQGKWCTKCRHMKDFGGPKLYCYVGPMSRPCSTMRERRGMCGPEGNLWEKKNADTVYDAQQLD